jgi:chromosome segregation ATPase
MNYVHGALAGTLANKLDTARASFKALRDAETNLAPKRNARASLQTQIGRIEHSAEKGYEKKLAELRSQLSKAEKEDEPLEKEIKVLKRKAVRESEIAKWNAFREVNPIKPGLTSLADRGIAVRGEISASRSSFCDGHRCHADPPAH